MRRTLAWITVLLLLGVLAACMPPSALVTAELPARPKAAAIVAYSVLGRISVRHADTSYAAMVDWQHEPSRDEILLTTPLGLGIAQLTRTSSGARLRTSDGRVVAAADWESLAPQLFGSDLPLALLPRWMVADAPASAQRDAAGRPRQFAHGVWTVDYGRYESAAVAALPLAVDIRGPDLELRIIVDAWQDVR